MWILRLLTQLARFHLRGIRFKMKTSWHIFRHGLPAPRSICEASSVGEEVKLPVVAMRIE